MKKKLLSTLYPFVAIILGLAVWHIGYAVDKPQISLETPPPPDLLVKNVFFKTPGIQTLTITNQTSAPITINSLNFNDKPEKLNSANALTVDSSRCSFIPANDTCSVPVTVAPESRGNHLLNIDYSLNGQKKSIATNIGINITKLAFYKIVNGQALPTNGEFSINAASSPQTFMVKNTGSFIWRGKIDWTGSGLSGVTKQKDSCKMLSPNQTCTFQLITDGSAIPGGTATLRASGDTIDDIDNNVVISGDVAIMLEENPQHKLYPAYSAIKMENTTNYDANIINVVISKSLKDDKIKFCSATSADCFYKSDTTCDINGGALPAGKSCLMWFKSLPNESADIGGTDGSIAITAFVEWKPSAQQLKAQKDLPDNIKVGTALPKKKTFNANYEQDLYAAGNFYGQVAKWDGENWDILGLGFSGTAPSLNALTYTGRLVAGGYFNMADGYSANNLAAWNGKHWSALMDANGGNGVVCDTNCSSDPIGDPEGGVDTLRATDINQDKFCIGGHFDIAGIKDFKGGYVCYTGTPDTNTGIFARGSSNGDPKILGAVHAIEHGVNIDARFGNKYFGNYVGGNFLIITSTDPIPLVNYFGIAFYSNIPSSFSAYWQSLPFSDFPLGHEFSGFGLNNRVFALKSLDSNLYIGGAFKTDYYFQTFLNKIALWDGKHFYPLSNGFDNTVRSLEILNNNLYAGGDFINSGTINVNHIARWDGNNWSTLGSGLNDSVYAITAFNNNLYVGGNFTMAGSNDANHIAKWDGNKWSAIGDGLFGGPVNAITFGTTLTISNP